MPVEDLRIKHRPPTEHPDFQVFHIRDDKWYKKRTNRINECSLFIEDRTYKQIRVREVWEDWMRIGVWGFVCDESVKQTLKGIAWDSYTLPTMQGTRELTQGDIITAYKEHKDG